MSIEKTEAVVLRAINYRDTSKIVTLYTKRYGKMSAIAKGTRNPKSKFGSLFQPLNYLQIVFYRRENRDIQYVSSGEFLKYFKSLTTDVLRLSIAMSLVEIINRVMHDEEENEPVFNLLVGSLSALDEPGTSPKNVFTYFGLHLADELGFRPNFETCFVCKRQINLEKEKKVYYVVQKGGPICEACFDRIVPTGSDFYLSAPALLALRSFVSLSAGAAAKAEIAMPVQNELSNFVFVYLRRHSDTLQEIKSLAILRSP